MGFNSGFKGLTRQAIALLIFTHFVRCGGPRCVVLGQTGIMDCYSYDVRVCMFCSCVSPSYLLEDPFWRLKVFTDPHFRAHVNIERADGRYPK